MNVVVLIIMLVIELFISYVIFNEDIISPAVIFPGVFLFAALDLLSMLTVWKTDIHFNTVLVVSGGCLIFIITSLIAKKCLLFKIPQILPNHSAKREMKRSIQLLFIFLNLFIFIYVARKIVEIVRFAGFNRNILAAFGTYAYLSKVGNVNTDIGKLASNLYQFTQAESYFWGYMLVEQWYEKKKVPALILANFIITTLSSFLCGSRTGAIFSVISLFPIFVIKYRKNTRRKHLKKKYIFLFFTIVVILMFSFQWIGELIDRKLDGINLWEYISIYIGAPILNLDFFIQEPHSSPEIWGYNTFATQIRYLRGRLRMGSHHFDLPFRSVNGHNLGNVYTTFYAYIYDFGIIGMIILTSIMAIVIQQLYKKAKNDINHEKGITLSILTFACLFTCVAFSFFSNKFYEQIDMGFVKRLIYWIILPRVLFTKKNSNSIFTETKKE